MLSIEIVTSTEEIIKRDNQVIVTIENQKGYSGGYVYREKQDELVRLVGSGRGLSKGEANEAKIQLKDYVLSLAV